LENALRTSSRTASRGDGAGTLRAHARWGTGRGTALWTARAVRTGRITVCREHRRADSLPLST